MEISIFRPCSQVMAIAVGRVWKLKLYHFVVSYGTLIEWSVKGTEQSTYPEMRFETCKKSSIP